MQKNWSKLFEVAVGRRFESRSKITLSTVGVFTKGTQVIIFPTTGYQLMHFLKESSFTLEGKIHSAIRQLNDKISECQKKDGEIPSVNRDYTRIPERFWWNNSLD